MSTRGLTLDQIELEQRNRVPCLSQLPYKQVESIHHEPTTLVIANRYVRCTLPSGHDGLHQGHIQGYGWRVWQ